MHVKFYIQVSVGCGKPTGGKVASCVAQAFLAEGMASFSLQGLCANGWE